MSLFQEFAKKYVVHVASLPYCEFPTGDTFPDNVGSIVWSKEQLIAYRFIKAMLAIGVTVEVYMGRDHSNYVPTDTTKPPAFLPGKGIWDPAGEHWVVHRERFLASANERQVKYIESKDVRTHIFVSCNVNHTAYAKEAGFTHIVEFCLSAYTGMERAKENSKIFRPFSSVIYMSLKARGAVEAALRFGIDAFACSTKLDAVIPQMVFVSDVATINDAGTEKPYGGKPYVLSICKRSSSRQGIEVMIAAVKKFREDYKCDMQLVVAGLGSNEQPDFLWTKATDLGCADAWIKELDVVTNDKDKKALIFNATAFMSVKMTTNYNNGIAMEAALAGVPVICSEHSAVAETLQYFQGHFVCRDNLEEYVEALATCVSGDARSKATLCTDALWKIVGAEVVTEKIVKFMEEAASKKFLEEQFQQIVAQRICVNQAL